MIRLTMAVAVLALGAAAWANTEESLPTGEPVIASVVHGVKFPLEKRISVDAAIARFYGDRLASTWAIGIEPKYHLSEKLWLGAPIFMYTSKPVDGFQFASPDANVFAADPGLSVGPVIGYDAIYGKFVVGDRIQHFRAGLNAGLIGLQMKSVIGNADSSALGDGKLSLGVQGGGQIQLQMGENWVGDVFTTLMLHQAGRLQSGDFGGARVGWLYGLGIGRVF